MKKTDIEQFFARLRDANPARRPSWNIATPFQLLVAVVLSAQATDVGVNKATRALFAGRHTPQKMLALGEAGLTRAHQDHRPVPHQGEERHRAVAAAGRTSIGGEVPREREALEALPGVGRKTANVVLNIAFGAADHRRRHPHLPRRQPHRPGARQDAARRSSESWRSSSPGTFNKDAHHWLILHGRYVCKARKPECWRCVVADLCRYQGKLA